AEAPARLGAAGNTQHDLLAIQGPHAKPGSQCCLRQVERHLADDVQALTVEEAVRLHLECDEEVTGRRPRTRRLPLASHAHPGAGFGAWRDGDGHLTLGANLAHAMTRGTCLGRDPAAPSALRARPVHREAALAEADRAPTLAFRAGRPRRTRRAAGARAGRTR